MQETTLKQYRITKQEVLSKFGISGEVTSMFYVNDSLQIEVKE